MRRSALLQRQKRQAENALKEAGAKEFRSGLEANERENAVKLVLGQRMSLSKWRISRKISCMEVRAGQEGQGAEGGRAVAAYLP